MKAMDVYFSFTYASTQLVDRKVPWRGGREKHSKLIQIIIGALKHQDRLSLMLMHIHVGISL